MISCMEQAPNATTEWQMINNAWCVYYLLWVSYWGSPLGTNTLTIRIIETYSFFDGKKIFTGIQQSSSHGHPKRDQGQLWFWAEMLERTPSKMLVISLHGCTQAYLLVAYMFLDFRLKGKVLMRRSGAFTTTQKANFPVIPRTKGETETNFMNEESDKTWNTFRVR